MKFVGRTASGFTLIEVMITVVVLAILASIALPSYQSSVRKGRRSDAVDAAVAVLQAQERFRANNPSYGATLSAIGQSSNSLRGNYTLGLSSVSAAGYTLTATAASGSPQLQDSGCTALTVTVTNGTPTYAPATCWSK